MSWEFCRETARDANPKPEIRSSKQRCRKLKPFWIQFQQDEAKAVLGGSGQIAVKRHKSRKKYKSGASLCADGFAEDLEALGDADIRVFFAFKFDAAIARVAGVGKDFGNSFVIQVKRVPFSASVISFGLHVNGPGSDLLELVVGVLHEIAGVHESAEPGGGNGVD